MSAQFAELLSGVAIWTKFLFEHLHYLQPLIKCTVEINRLFIYFCGFHFALVGS